MEQRASVFRRNPKTTRLVLLVAVLVVVELTAGAARKALNRRILGIEKTYRVRSEVYHHGLLPKRVVSNAVWGTRTYSIITNSLGFRDASTREVPLSTSTHRIVFIGDSFTEGIGVSFQDSYVGRISTALKERNIEVLNAAVASYSPSLYVAKIRHLLEVADLKFNELFVSIDISDPSDDIGYHRTGTYYTDTPPAPKRVGQQIKDLISDNTVVTHAILKTAKDLIEPPRETEHWRSRWTDERGYLNHHTLGLELNSKNMDELAALVAAKGIRLTVAVYPHPRQIRAGRLDSPAVTHWKRWSAEHHVDFIDLFPRFINGSDWKEVVDTYFIPGDIHVNEKGHEIFAAAFLDHIGKRQ
jgi:lysophospholipase L1-like esterase